MEVQPTDHFTRQVTMLPPQLISNRIRDTLRTVEPSPKHRGIRLWQILHGSNLLGYASFVVSIVSPVSAIWYQVPTAELYSTLYFCIVFYCYHEFIVFWSSRRVQVKELSDSLAVAAAALETRSTKTQIAKMMKVTWISRLISMLYRVDLFFIGLMYWVYPLQQGRLATSMPLVPQEAYWGMYWLQSGMLAIGTINTYSLLSYHIEVCLCLTTLFNVLGEQFKHCVSRQDINALIEVHQGLLDTFRQLQVLFSHTWFTILFTIVWILITSTYITIAEKVEIVFILVMFSVLGFLLAPCVLSEMISVSYESVGDRAFTNDWINRANDFRRDLALVIFRSYRASYLTAGLFGKLGMTKFVAVLNRWYTALQALLKLH